MATRMRMTLEQFLALEEQKPYLEYYDGEVIQKCGGENWHSRVQWLLSITFDLHLQEHPIGQPRPELQCIFGRDGHRWALVPDVCFISDSNPRRARGNRPYRGVPDLVIEIVSPDDRASRVARKLRNYLENGVRLVWLIDPAERMITVMTSLSASRILRDSDTLDGGDVLPDFAVPVRDLLPPANEPAGGDDEDEDDEALDALPSC